MPPDSVASKVLTLLFTDLAGSTSLKTEKGDKVAGELISRYREHVAKIAEDNNGRIIDWAGDGCFLTFEAPSIAVKFALRLQQTHAEDADLPKVYIGIHMGEVTERSGADGTKVEGLAVDIASRIQALALPGQILMSDAVFNSARQQLDSQELDMPISWQAQGAYIFEGFDDPINVGEVGIDSISPFESPTGSQKAHRAVTPAEEDTLGWRPASGQAIPGRQNWVIDSQLGEGGFGEVWLASNINTKVKRVFKFCFEVDRLKGLKREVVLLRLLKESLGDREDIARVIDWDVENYPYYIETEYGESGDLKAWSNAQGGIDKVPFETRLELVAQTADALSAAHSAGVLHKDLKPANILISQASDSQTPKASLTDFGIGLVTDINALKDKGITATGLTQTLVGSKSTSGSGTALYIAPEILEGNIPTHQSDIYALGVILYQVVIGNLSRAVAQDWQRDVKNELLVEDIASCISGLPENRLQDGSELAKRLRSLGQRQQELDEEQQETEMQRASILRRQKIRKIALYGSAIAAAIAIAAIFGTLHYRDSSREAMRTWAYKTAIPQIRELVEVQDYVAAHKLVEKASQFIPNDPTLLQLMSQSSREFSMSTTPSGATVLCKLYESINAEWIRVGVTPIEKFRLPIGMYRWKIAKTGYQEHNIAGPIVRASSPAKYRIDLIEEDRVPAGMLAIPGGNSEIPIAGIEVWKEFDNYYIDRMETTNKEFRQFIAAGGYTNPVFWEQAFEADGKALSWVDAMKVFVDRTGWPGPSTWELGSYPEEQDNHPVSGVSWYEAAAYAKFRGKSLPTIYHWTRAAASWIERHVPLFPYIIAQSNVGGSGTVRVGTTTAISAYGASDMAGNVREWCHNASGTMRYSLGGDWEEPDYSFIYPYAQNAWDRSPGNGIRCAIYPEGTDIPDELFQEVKISISDLSDMPALSDEALQFQKGRWHYVRTPLNPTIEPVMVEGKDWVRQKTSIDAVYNDERIIIYIDFPRLKRSSYKAVIFFPGIGALLNPTFPDNAASWWDCIYKSGRVLIQPLFSGMYERGEGQGMSRLESNDAPELVREWVLDLKRVVDYLETRTDIDTQDLSYLGYSLGAEWYTGPQFAVAEERLKSAIFYSGGYAAGQSRLEATYNPLVKIPVLMLGGKHDYLLPLSHQKSFFDSLGTPPEHKRHVVFDSGHGRQPHIQVAKEMVSWLDKYQGPVTKE